MYDNYIAISDLLLYLNEKYEFNKVKLDMVDNTYNDHREKFINITTEWLHSKYIVSEMDMDGCIDIGCDGLNVPNYSFILFFLSSLSITDTAASVYISVCTVLLLIYIMQIRTLLNNNRERIIIIINNR